MGHYQVIDGWINKQAKKNNKQSQPKVSLCVYKPVHVTFFTICILFFKIIGFFLLTLQWPCSIMTISNRNPIILILILLPLVTLSNNQPRLVTTKFVYFYPLWLLILKKKYIHVEIYIGQFISMGKVVLAKMKLNNQIIKHCRRLYMLLISNKLVSLPHTKYISDSLMLFSQLQLLATCIYHLYLISWSLFAL